MSNDVAQARAQHQELQKLIGIERQTVAMFLLRLMEFEREKMHERLGYASIWNFCHRGLGLAESTINRRLRAIRIVERFPVVVEYLGDGRLCTTTMLMLSDALTPENAIELFDQASRKSMKEIELIVATAMPRPAPQARMQKLPEARVVNEPAPGFTFEAASTMAVASPEPPTQAETCPLPSRPARRSEIHPISGQEYVAQLPVSRAWVGKLEMAKKLGSHVVPSRDPVAILELALDLFIEKHGKRRGAIAVRSVSKKKTATPQPAKRDRFTAKELRLIWARDEGKCTWLMDSGERCGSEHQLEVDHIDAVALGGRSDPDRARLLCRRHNDQHARETFGEAFMAAKKVGQRW